MAGDYLDVSVNVDRYEFRFSDTPLFNNVEDKELTGVAVEDIRIYLSDDLGKIKFQSFASAEVQNVENFTPDMFDNAEKG